MSMLGRIALGASRQVDAWRSGLRRRLVRVHHKDVAYFDGGRGQPIVLLHGLGDNRNSFVRCVSHLTRHSRVILPDLPGHGESSGTAEDAGSFRALVQWLDAFLDGLGLGSVVLGGNSLGGHVAIAFALSYSVRVDRLVLVNPAGVGMPVEEIYTGFGAPLGGRGDLARLMRRACHEPPKVPWFVANYLIKEINARMPEHNEVARRLRSESGIRLDAQMRDIEAETLILWGKHDKVLLPSVLEPLRCIRHARLVELEAGHSPQLERPDAVGTELSAFLHP